MSFILKCYKHRQSHRETGVFCGKVYFINNFRNIDIWE
jgi:hypothetical protein